jgi:thioredoxin 1
MSEAVTSVTVDTFDQVVLQAPNLVMVDFWATWYFAKVNTDENPDLASRYNIRGIPTLIFYKDGKVLDQVVGAVPKAQLKSKIDTFLG